MKREVPVEEAIGLRLAHDLTRIIPGEFKGIAFSKGHVVQEEDVSRLLDMGKRHVYVLELGDDEMHEDDAAVRMANLTAGRGILTTAPHEGKVVFKAEEDGMLFVDVDKVFAVNMIEDVSLTTRVPFIAVKAGQSVAGVRPIPLTFRVSLMEEMERTVGNAKLVEVWPYLPQRISIVTTGSEVQSGRVTDAFGPVLREKFASFGMSVENQAIVGDEMEDIVGAIQSAVAGGATLVCVTGGMSVDPDDRSPGAIRRVADEVVTQGTPMLPGSMMMVAYVGQTVIFGLPGAVIHDKWTAFDVLLPRALANWRFTKADIARQGAGGWLNA